MGGDKEGFRLADSRFLVDVAMGRVPADIVIRDGRWVCVQSGETIEHTDVAIAGDRIAYVGSDAGHCIGARTRLIEAGGRHLVPGLLDGHMHVESGMLTVTEFVRAVVPHGTTCMIIDPHEMANIFGLRGVRLMVDEAALQPIHVFVEVPSCVPSAPGLETPGSLFGPAEVEEALSWPGVVGLGEMMDFAGVCGCGLKVHEEMSLARRAGKVVGGHYASPDLGLPFHGYAAGGAQDDHEGTTAEDAAARVRQGMRPMLRYGSAWHDAAAQIRAVTRMGLDPRNFILCTDDSHSETLASEGHMDRVVRHVISEGLAPMTAIQMATLNPAEHFGLARDIGQIAPGRYADIVVTADLAGFRADLVIARGRVVAENGALRAPLPSVPRPEWAMRSIHLKSPAVPGDFRLAPRPDVHAVEASRGNDGADCSEARAHVIGVIENQAPTRHLKMNVPVRAGQVVADIPRDIAKIAVLDRHHASGRVTVGLVHGFGFTRRCAIATTVAHDCHNMLVVGTDDECMAIAVNAVASCGGGQIVVRDNEVIGRVSLPIAGILSDRPASEVAREAATVLEGFKACGCPLNNPNMQLSLLGLSVIPELRLSDLGLVDVSLFRIVSVLE